MQSLDIKVVIFIMLSETKDTYCELRARILRHTFTSILTCLSHKCYVLKVLSLIHGSTPINLDSKDFQ